MIDQLPEMPTPPWLTEASASTMEHGAFPLEPILRGSLYYPSSGFDGDPVRYLGGNILSFVYVDYGYDESTFLDEVHRRGFAGYRLVGTRRVQERELVPNGWTPTPPRPEEGDPAKYWDWIKEPFCRWCVFAREPNFDRSHGPDRFSLLYLCADGVAAFQALYTANGHAPKALAIIQPGTGFGMNYTNFKDPEGPLARSVRGNRAGEPSILLSGGYGRLSYHQNPCWDGYPKRVALLDKSGRGSVGVWTK